ncbi:MAG: dephospho-CoA kinase [Candidatus Dormibacteria bacterium]
MRCIGLTGGIATGKSSVAALLAVHGAAIVDADELSRQVVGRGRPALTEIAGRFGGDVIGPDGSLDRQALGRTVFADKESRRDLERIIHPRILELIAAGVSAARSAGGPAIVVDIPLLYELHLEGGLDGVMVVYAPPATQLSRLVARDGLPPDAARLRIGTQLPIDQKRSRATWVIDNSGSPDDTRVQVDRWWQDVIIDGAAEHP